jgi:hypothetical protein
MMLRRLTRRFDDDTTGDVWVNPDHIRTIRPEGNNGRHAYVNFDTEQVKVVGWATDVAKELNGYYDEG